MCADTCAKGAQCPWRPLRGPTYFCPVASQYTVINDKKTKDEGMLLLGEVCRDATSR